MAEGVFLSILIREASTDLFEIDSASLLDYHRGELADGRMRSHARARGYMLTHRSRPVVKDDFDRLDWIVGMDDQNIRGLKHMTSNPLHLAKIYLITDFSKKMNATHVPDPYYSGDEGFENVIDLLEDACQGLFEVVSL